MNNKTQRQLEWHYTDDGKLTMNTCLQQYCNEFDRPWDRRYHTLEQKEPLSKSKVLERLMRLNTQYRNKMDTQMLKNKQKKKELGNLSEKEILRKQQAKAKKLYKHLVKIDYSQRWDSTMGTFGAETTFTWLDWCIAESIKKRSGLPFEALVPDEKYRQVFSIYH